MSAATAGLRPLLAAGLLVAVAGCAGDGAATGPGGEATAGRGESTAASGPAPTLPRGDEPVQLDPAEFTAEIDHLYWPMEPGTRWVYEEIEPSGATVQVVITATSETREIANGITARVVRDTVTEDGSIIEDTFDWYAQDGSGAVWYLGEDTAEFEDGEITTRAGSFEAGVDGALPGVLLPADPEPGMAYRQEYYAGEAEDNGEVLSKSEMADVPAGHYENMLLTKDTITIEPDVLEYKLYAPGVGPALVLGVSGGGGREELVEVSRVSAAVAEAAGTTALGEAYG